MNRFKIGDRVVCIRTDSIGNNGNGNLPRLIKGRQYIVSDVSYCSTCGQQALDVGLATDLSNNGRMYCICGASRSKTIVHWCSSRRFAKWEEKSNTAEEEALLKEVNEILNKQTV